MGDSLMKCPFCGLQAIEYDLLLHIEESHSEGDSPFVVRNADDAKTMHDSTDPDVDGSQEDEGLFSECPVEGCGEALLAKELEDHLELHAEEVQEVDSSPGSASDSAADAGSRPPESRHQHADEAPSHRRDREERRRHRHSRDKSSRATKQSSAIQAWRKLLSMPQAKSPSPAAGSATHHSSSRAANAGAAHSGSEVSVAATSTSGTPKKKRLGKAELGKYAHERRMPDWLVDHLRRGFGVRQEGVLPVLEQLLEQSPSTKYAYLCHPCVQHVSKLKKEGGFCGYRNIQMMASYIVGSRFVGAEHFPDGKLPTIFQIQDLIEEAWDRGINAQGRVETGGVRGTRKYIGTPEAQAVICSLDVPCEAQGYRNKEPGRSEERLLREVERYFESAVLDPTYKVRTTTLPPIYFQHAGHSMTIVGFEKLKNGLSNLLVFDPMFHDAPGITRLVGRCFEHGSPDVMLKPYRRGHKYLGKYYEFEVLRLDQPLEADPSLQPGPAEDEDVADGSKGG